MDEAEVRQLLRRAHAREVTGADSRDQWSSIVDAGVARRRTRARRRAGLALVSVVLLAGVAVALDRPEQSDDVRVTGGPADDVDVTSIPPSDGRQGVCIRVSSGEDALEGCLDSPLPSVWTVAGERYVVSYGSPQADSVASLRGPAVVVTPLDSFVERGDGELPCVLPELYDAVERELRRPFSVTACTPSYALVTPLTTSGREPLVSVFEQQPDGWTASTTIDFSLPHDQRCASFEGPAPRGGPSLRDLCSSLG